MVLCWPIPKNQVEGAFITCGRSVGETACLVGKGSATHFGLDSISSRHKISSKSRSCKTILPGAGAQSGCAGMVTSAADGTLARLKFQQADTSLSVCFNSQQMSSLHGSHLALWKLMCNALWQLPWFLGLPLAESQWPDFVC